VIKLFIWIPVWVSLVAMMWTDKGDISATVFYGCLFIGFSISAVGVDICDVINKEKNR
jgi:hypothetical protein